MSFNNPTNTMPTGGMPTFTLPRDNAGNVSDVLTGKRDQYNYQTYQQQYKNTFGVYPELDKLNDPICALAATDGHVFLPEKLDKAVKESKSKGGKALAGGIANIVLNVVGVGSVFDESNMANIASLSGTEYYDAFRREFEEAIRKYKYAYSLILNLDFSYASNMSDCKNINDGLGYKKAGNRYYEGTWENGKITYGLMWLSDIKYAFIGTFDENALPDEGVALMIEKTGYELEAGLFSLVDFNNTKNIGTLTTRHGLRICIDNSAEFPTHMAAGGFENDEFNGTVYFLGISREGVAQFSTGEYDYGDEVKGVKNKTTAILLCLFLGFLGAHKFYEGKTGMGVLYLFTWGLFGIGVWVDLIRYITGK